ncbi:MAG: type II toxin-antitoxin system HicA family toxin [Synergistaceae bacterium]|nr:type II toxin-antitoxin system HicA family toxin [Synergistaceae bacterium]
MPELRGFSGAEAMKILLKIGFAHVRTKGSHAVLRKGSRVCVLPMHHELAPGTLSGVLRQAGVSPEDFLANC